MIFHLKNDSSYVQISVTAEIQKFISQNVYVSPRTHSNSEHMIYVQKCNSSLLILNKRRLDDSHCVATVMYYIVQQKQK